ncbi:hypothetical protein BZL29_7867 [Mycobacterium kansasii]|uniref:Uncharacterized protein n=1 Tax=Mycobacterium kansasii TaxID=1768 RepID=A0A1V3WEP7_MYCKA|nr:hypothetical protein BZL29_7867 [Mycobacterium kansasii]
MKRSLFRSRCIVIVKPPVRKEITCRYTGHAGPSTARLVTA